MSGLHESYFDPIALLAEDAVRLAHPVLARAGCEWHSKLTSAVQAAITLRLSCTSIQAACKACD